MASSLLLGAIESGHQVVGAIRHNTIKMHPFKRFFKDIFNAEEFLVLIREFNIKEIKAKSVNSDEFFAKALKLHPDIILVGSWGEILDKRIIDLPRIACINCHPSLLPKYRGPNPYMETIRNGETQSGITFHLMNEQFDQGPILMQKAVAINPDDTGGMLRSKCVYTARQILPEVLAGLSEGTTLPLRQNESTASYYPRIKIKDALIDWKNNADVIYNQIRAFNPWQHCFFLHNNTFIKVNSSKIIDIRQNLQPGLVVGKKGTKIMVSTGTSGKGLLFENPKVFGFFGTLFGGFYIRHKIKVGDILEKLKNVY
jgi:methionyl-tRNA formyltransferase